MKLFRIARLSITWEQIKNRLYILPPTFGNIDMMWLHLFEVLSSDEKYKKLTNTQ